MDDLSRVFDTVSRYFSLLAEPMRVRILHAICHAPRTVNEIAEEAGASQTAVSRHLNLMYRAGVLSRRRDGNLVYYGVVDTTLTDICRTVCTQIVASADAANDRARMLELASDLQRSSRQGAAPPDGDLPGGDLRGREPAPRARTRRAGCNEPSRSRLVSSLAVSTSGSNKERS